MIDERGDFHSNNTSGDFHGNNRKWSDYIAGTQVLFENNEAFGSIIKQQLSNRHQNFVDAHTVEQFKKENKREWNFSCIFLYSIGFSKK